MLVMVMVRRRHSWVGLCCFPPLAARSASFKTVRVSPREEAFRSLWVKSQSPESVRRAEQSILLQVAIFIDKIVTAFVLCFPYLLL